MSNTKFNVDSLPVTLDGKIEMIPRRQYENHRASEFTVRFKVDVKKANVHDMIDMIVAGKVLEDSNEEQWFKVYDLIKADIELAQEEGRKQVEEANRLAEEKKKKEEEDKNRDAELVVAASETNIAETFANLGQHFDLGAMDRCIPKEGTTDETLMSALVAGIKMEEFSNWAKGDLVVELENRGRVGAMVSLCDKTGIPYKSIYRMAVTARNVPPDERDPDVGFTTYAEVANARFSKDEDKNKAIMAATLEKIAPKTGNEKKDAGVITTALEARKAVQAAQGKEPPTPPDPLAVDLDKHLFLVVNYSDGETRASIGYPLSLEDTDGIDIIHAKTGRKSFGKGTKMKWTALDKHEEPEPEPPAETEKQKAAREKKEQAEAAAQKKKDDEAAAKAAAAPKGKGKGKK